MIKCLNIVNGSVVCVCDVNAKCSIWKKRHCQLYLHCLGIINTITSSHKKHPNQKLLPWVLCACKRKWNKIVDSIIAKRRNLNHIKADRYCDQLVNVHLRCVLTVFYTVVCSNSKNNTILTLRKFRFVQNEIRKVLLDLNVCGVHTK